MELMETDQAPVEAEDPLEIDENEVDGKLFTR